MESLRNAMPLLASLGLVALLVGVWVLSLWRNARRVSDVLKKRLWEQGWNVERVEHRWLRRGPYFFSANRGIVFRIRASDGVGSVFNGFANVAVDWDDYATERIEILWDAIHANQASQLSKPPARPKPEEKKD